MTLTVAPVEIPIEELRAGDQVIVTRKIGPRRVVRVEYYEPTPPETRKLYDVVYESFGPGISIENRAGHKGTSTYHRGDEATMYAIEKGHAVQIRPRRS